MPRTLITRMLAATALTLTLAGVSSPAFASTSAHARGARTTVNFVGNYTAHFTVNGQSTPCGLAIKANGTAVAQCSHQTAHWTQSGAKITIVYKSGSVVQTFKGTKTPT